MADKTGITFGSFHTYTDWGLRLKKIDLGTPEPVTEYIKIPGMNGLLDLTESQYGGITYGMRTLQFYFDVRNNSYTDWCMITSEIMSVIQGKKLKIILDTDPNYYYKGRCTVRTAKQNAIISSIEIECYCEPYKYSVKASDEPWQWDPFSFRDGLAQNTSNIIIDSTEKWQGIVIYGHDFNDIPIITVSSPMTVKFDRTEYFFSTGEHTMYGVGLQAGKNIIYVKGKGTISIHAEGGRL